MTNLLDRTVKASISGELRLPVGFWQLEKSAREIKAAELLGAMEPTAQNGDGGGPTLTCQPRSNTTGKIRVGFVTPSLALGGAETWVVTLQEHLAGPRIHITGTAMVHDKAEPFLRRRAAACGDVFVGEGAIEHIAAKSDVLITWGIASIWDRLARLPIRIVVVSHGSGTWATRNLQGCPACFEIVAVSQAAAQVTSRDDVTVIYNGISPDYCQPKRTREEMREQWGIAPEKILIGCVGRLTWEKGIAVTAAAVSSLGRGYQGVFVGSQPNSLHTAGLLSLCPDAIVRGPVSHVGNIYGAIDCYTLPSITEAFSLALAEAWYCGLPVVATRVGAVPELEAQYGQLVVPVPVQPRPQEMVVAIKKALNPANRPVIERAQSAARQYWTAAAMADRWTEYICR